MSRLKIKKINIKIILFASLAVVGIFSLLVAVDNEKQKPEIITSEVKNIAQGRITEGLNMDNNNKKLQTESALKFESEEITPPQKNANAAVFKWDQTKEAPEAKSEVEIRTFDGKNWTDWTDYENQLEDRKDGTPIVYDTLVLAEKINKIQYRFTLEGKPGMPSPEIDLEKTSLEIIDSTKGPSPTKKSVLKNILDKFGLFKSVSARADGPRIISRTEWGSPEGESSPRWDPEYEPLYRGIVHHTVTASDGDIGATIRAIWHFHANTRGWGDIGYNYLVDSSGNVFQGRYFNHNEAHSLRKDVVAGHALNNNRGTTGIAAIGDFTDSRPSDRMTDSIANIVAFKLANYQINPSGIGPNGPNIVGHREVNQTGCPGNGLYGRISEIRQVGDHYYAPRASMNILDLTNQGQGYDGNFAFSTNMISGETKEAYFDLRNEGDHTWNNSGANPTMLGTDQPYDRSSTFATAGSWHSVNRAATFGHKVVTEPDGTKNLVNTNTIIPGETGRFSFIITAPEAGGMYREHFQLLVEGRQWFTRNLLLSTNINVTPRIYSWQPIAQHIYTDNTQTIHSSTTNLTPGQRVYLVIKAKNTGNQTWLNTGPTPIRVGTSGPRDRASLVCDNTWVNCGRPSTLQEASVSPGNTGTFGFWIRAPNQAYQGNEYFSLLAENRTWINTEPGIFWPVRVQ